EDSIRQVLFNIIQNAIDASPEGGCVDITLKDVNGHLKIMVADKGSGIPDELQIKIFEPFFSTKGKIPTGGLGLGLSICKGTLDMMGGSLDFKSEINKGTTFIIELPINVVRKDFD
ncbi:MAG: sensor histidine kinase, partial [Candidatus Scalindua sp.]